MNPLTRIFTLTIATILTGSPLALSQSASASQPTNRSEPDTNSFQLHTFYLHGDPQVTLQEAYNTVRQALANSKSDVISSDYSQNAIILSAPAGDIAIAQKILDSIDHPRKAWRLTYTVTEIDGDKRIGAQHYSLVAVAGQQAVLKQGDRIPIAVTSVGNKESAIPLQAQMTYQDIGMTFNATLDDFREGARLRSDVAQTSLADQTSGFGQQDPVIRQAELKNEAMLTPGKPLILGAMDIPGSTRHLEIEVLIETLP